ncbi:MAG: hypothetical protein KGL39_51625 [Patescibacteria group bacterium]|nr:hypothetical protein [Patescibacteria group bacterium]
MTYYVRVSVQSCMPYNGGGATLRLSIAHATEYCPRFFRGSNTSGRIVAIDDSVLTDMFPEIGKCVVCKECAVNQAADAQAIKEQIEVRYAHA